MTQHIIPLEELTMSEAMEIIGQQDQNLKLVCQLSNTEIIFRNNQFMIQSESAQKIQEASSVLATLLSSVRRGLNISPQEIHYLFRSQAKNRTVDLDCLKSKIVARTHQGKTVAPKTEGQRCFIEAMEKKSVVFAVGPAGTGKTYLAVAHAATLLKKGEIHKIILTRPAVEAGESLGFLPGDLKEKVDPYLRPLYDGLHDMLGAENTERLIEKGTIEIAPLAYMRGRTLDEAVIILDEAQNTTPAQMKMFLTRLGSQSSMIITGDITQIDLPRSQRSGLVEAIDLLKEVEEIAVLHLSSDDVVRHPLVQKIIECYAQKGE